MKQVSILLALAFLAGILLNVKQATASAGYEEILEMAREHRREENSKAPMMGWRRKRSVRGRRFFPVRSINQNRFFGRRIVSPYVQRFFSEGTLKFLISPALLSEQGQFAQKF